jgi:hypothetical protein
MTTRKQGQSKSKSKAKAKIKAKENAGVFASLRMTGWVGTDRLACRGVFSR